MVCPENPPIQWTAFWNQAHQKHGHPTFHLEVTIASKQYATNVIQWQDITISAIAGKKLLHYYVLFNQQAVLNALEEESI